MEPPFNPAALASSLPAGERGGPRDVRASGWILIAVGVVVSTSMAVLIRSLKAQTSFQLSGGGAVYRQDSRELTRTIDGLYGSIFLFGLVCLAAGTYQVRTVTRSRWLNILLMLSAVGIVFFAWRIATTAL